MEVVILAAGSGRRLGAGLPKCMFYIGGRTLLDWQIRTVRAAFGKSVRIFVVTGFRHCLVADHVRKAYRRQDTIEIIRNPFWQVSGICGSAYMAAQKVTDAKVLRLDGDLLLGNASDLIHLTSRGVSMFAAYECTGRPNTPIIYTNPDASLVGIDVVQNTDEEGWLEWACLDFYNDYLFRDMMNAWADWGKPNASYFELVNFYASKGQFQVQKINRVPEIDRSEDIPYAQRHVNGSRFLVHPK
jgi:CTP:molybdopterin cytidylyltransferase MocA